MHNRKFIDLCKTLDAKELKTFEKYVHSPFFNRNKKVVQLFVLLKKHHPKYEHASLVKEKLFVKLYPKKKFSEQTFKNLLSELAKLLEGFLVYQILQEEKATQERLLLEALYVKNLPKQFIHKIKEAKKRQQQQPFQDIDYWQHAYTLERYSYSFEVASKGRSLDASLSKVIEHLDYYYIAEKLKYYAVLLNQQSFSSALSIRDELVPTHELLNHIPDLQAIPALSIYQQLVLLLKDKNSEEQYHKVKTVLLAHPLVLPKGQMRQIYTAMINYCNKQLKSGKDIYLQEIFDWYKVMLKRKVLLVQGYITPPIHFRNIVRAGLRLQEIDWIENFIKENEQKLHPEYGANIGKYCSALLAFHQQNYTETLQELLSFDFNDVYNYTEHKVLLVKTYFELEEWELLENLFNSFRVYLTRDKVIPVHFQKPYLNFIRFTERLMREKVSYSPDYKAIKLAVLAAEHIIDKEWLLNKTTPQTQHKTNNNL